jgi:hypothetical protein
MGFRTPPQDEDLVRCSACNWPIFLPLNNRPRGGEYQSSHTTTDTDNVHENTDGGQGCPFCGCPAWDSGGSLGDMRH